MTPSLDAKSCQPSTSSSSQSSEFQVRGRGASSIGPTSSQMRRGALRGSTSSAHLGRGTSQPPPSSRRPSSPVTNTNFSSSVRENLGPGGQRPSPRRLPIGPHTFSSSPDAFDPSQHDIIPALPRPGQEERLPWPRPSSQRLEQQQQRLNQREKNSTTATAATTAASFF